VRALSENPASAAVHERACCKFAELFDSLGAESLLEAGVGEATTLANVLRLMHSSPAHVFGFDISLSRLLVARAYAGSLGVKVNLFTATLESIPLPSDSIDVVYTSHSIEPNGGRERPILEELYRVARRYVVLREPSDELGSLATREHIAKHGYVRGLHATAESLGYAIVEHSLFGHDPNPSNQAAWTIIRKSGGPSDRLASRAALSSPISKTPLITAGGALYSPHDGLLFPVFGGVPCLLPDSGVLCLHWLEHAERTSG
jgi:SAM-dependent methyltransferase